MCNSTQATAATMNIAVKCKIRNIFNTKPIFLEVIVSFLARSWHLADSLVLSIVVPSPLHTMSLMQAVDHRISPIWHPADSLVVPSIEFALCLCILSTYAGDKKRIPGRNSGIRPTHWSFCFLPVSACTKYVIITSFNAIGQRIQAIIICISSTIISQSTFSSSLPSDLHSNTQHSTWSLPTENFLIWHLVIIQPLAYDDILLDYFCDHQINAAANNMVVATEHFLPQTSHYSRKFLGF